MPRAVKKTSSLRAALAAKQVRTAYWDVPLADHETTMTAATALRDAKQTVFVAGLGTDEQLQRAAAASLDKAQAAFDACSYRLVLRAVPDADRDALRNAYPEDDSVDLLADPYVYQLLAASAVDSDLTGDEWRAEMGSDRWRDTDRLELLRLAVEVNFRPFSHGIPKG